MGKLNEKFFFDYTRTYLFDGHMSQSQFDGISGILKLWNDTLATKDDRWLAYMLATAHHETGRTMQPVRETFAATDEKAISILEKAWNAGKLPWVTNPYWRWDQNHQSWLGRGLVQLTHQANYKRIGDAVGVNLVADPAAAMNPDVARQVMVQGMIKGVFTGYTLAQFFNPKKADWKNARRIINGIERADLVASYGLRYYAAISYTI
ncbi:glycoside hydrolase family 19 protein [Mesorhizobium sp. M0030]|uniref:glycoside hydrolase family 19 protein n=1 Tax=Mesorhizobium sp. M0030 TaxID=2956851 RepID=UPI0033394384